VLPYRWFVIVGFPVDHRDVLTARLLPDFRLPEQGRTRCVSRAILLDVFLQGHAALLTDDEYALVRSHARLVEPGVAWRRSKPDAAAFEHPGLRTGHHIVLSPATAPLLMSRAPTERSASVLRPRQ
jgi:hypothetical protein